MIRRALFKEADLARALKAAQGAGVTVGRIEIEADGKIVIVSRSPSQEEAEGREAARASLDALREKIRATGAKPRSRRGEAARITP